MLQLLQEANQEIIYLKEENRYQKNICMKCNVENEKLDYDNATLIDKLNETNKSLEIANSTNKVLKGDSKKTSDAFLWIFRLPRGLESLSWTFFNSPFCVDFKNVHFYII